MQLNLWMGKLTSQALKLIEQEQPDIICLQEVSKSAEGQAEVNMPDGIFNCYEMVMRQTGYEHGFFSPTLSMSVSGIGVDFGNAIISKYPLSDQKTVFVYGEYDADPDVTVTAPNIRNMQIATMSLGDKSFTLSNHHGYWEKNPMGSDTTVQALQKVVDELRTAAVPLVFAGDLNVQPESPAMRVFDDFLEDLTDTYKLETTLSQLGRAKNVACDHIMVTPDVRVKDFRACDELVSDHLALILEFDI